MKLVREPSEYRKPVNAGLMFFTEDPEDYFPCARIEAADKPDPTGIGMTEKIFRVPLDRQLQDALAYIRNYIIKEYILRRFLTVSWQSGRFTGHTRLWKKR